MISQERLKELLSYDPSTGVFVWRIARGRQPAGAIAGCDSNRGYIKSKVDGTEYYLHRLAWLYVHGEMPSADIDHINGDRDDNRIHNLRAVSRSENHKNRGIHSSNKSGRMGVFWNVRKQKWTARIKFNGVTSHLGDFDSIKDAFKARDEGERSFGFHENHGKRPAFEGRG